MPCARCDSDHALTHSWDGLDYCASCIAEVDESLQDLFESQSGFEEFISIPRDQILRSHAVALTIVAAGALALFIGFAIARGESILIMLLLWLAIVTPMVLLKTWGLFDNMAAVKGSVRIRDGVLHVSHRFRGQLRWQLCDAKWYVGPWSDASDFFPRLHVRGAIIILELPAPGILAGWMHERIPVGLTPETKQTWEAFLTLSRIPRLPGKTTLLRRLTARNNHQPSCATASQKPCGEDSYR